MTLVQEPFLRLGVTDHQDTAWRPIALVSVLSSPRGSLWMNTTHSLGTCSHAERRCSAGCAGEAPVLLTTVSITRMAWTWFGIVTYASRAMFGRMRGVRGPWSNAIGRHAVAGR